MDDRTLFAIGAGFYSLAFAAGLLQLLRKKPYPYAVVSLLLLAGFAGQTAGLYIRGQDVRSCPIGNPFEIFQFISWSTVMLYGIVGPAYRMSLLGFFSAALAAVMGLLPIIIPGWDANYGERIFADPLLETHAALAIFSYGVFALLFLTSAMLLFQNYGLKRKRFGGLFGNLPSIMELETVNGRLLLTSAIVYSVAVVLGTIYWRQEPDSVTRFKLISAMVIWSCYCVVLLLRWKQFLHGVRLARVCIALFIVALIALWPVELSRQAPQEEIIPEVMKDA